MPAVSLLGLDHGQRNSAGDRAVGRAIVVLDLLDRQQVGRAQMVDDQLRVASEGPAVAGIQVSTL
jgi:hypothetical protein